MFFPDPTEGTAKYLTPVKPRTLVSEPPAVSEEKGKRANVSEEEPRFSR